MENSAIRLVNSLLKLIFTLIFFIILSVNLDACEIHFSIIKGEKVKYNRGDELIIKTTVLLTHRNCPEGIKSTVFEEKGLEIIQATKWKEENSTTFTRKLKLKIIAENGKEISLRAIRKCEKEGGLGVMMLYKP